MKDRSGRLRCGLCVWQTGMSLPGRDIPVCHTGVPFYRKCFACSIPMTAKCYYKKKVGGRIKYQQKILLTEREQNAIIIYVVGA